MMCANFRTFLTVIFIVYFTVFGVLLPTLCRRWPYSMYFRAEKNDPEIVNQLLIENSARLSSSRQFLSSYDFGAATISNGEPVDLVIAVVTINRDTDDIEELGYLTQTVARVLNISKDDKSKVFDRKLVIVCNVDERSHQHLEAMSLSKFVHVTSKYPNITKAHDQQKWYTVFDKEKSDYVYCLRQAKSYHPNFILMLEDDVLLRLGSFTILNHLLRSRINPAELDESRTKSSWIFVKLYYPEKWQGYGNELDKIGELVGLAILGGAFLVCFVRLSSKIFKLRVVTTKTRLHLLFAVGAATALLVSVLIGRPYIQAWRRYLPYTHRIIPAPDCCTQAILYPASVVDELTQYLTKVTCTIDFSIDLAIDTFALKHNLKRHLVEPNLCHHIGFISTVRSYAKSAADFLE